PISSPITISLPYHPYLHSFPTRRSSDLTRLRTHVHDASLVDESLIRKAAVSGMVRPTKQSIQVIVGTKVQFVYDEVARLLAQSGADAELIGERPASELDQPPKTVLTGTSV